MSWPLAWRHTALLKHSRGSSMRPRQSRWGDAGCMHAELRNLSPLTPIIRIGCHMTVFCASPGTPSTAVPCLYPVAP